MEVVALNEVLNFAEFECRTQSVVCLLPVSHNDPSDVWFGFQEAPVLFQRHIGGGFITPLQDPDSGENCSSW